MKNIDRREFMATLAGGALAFGMPRFSFGDGNTDRPPNFVVIMADDLGAKELGCYGNKNHSTPNLDALAEGGVRFDTCYATPLCSPSRVMLMTGRYAFRTGWYSVIGNVGAPNRGTPQFEVGSSEVTFADLLKTRGYTTALAGKWQLSGALPTMIYDCGFDEYCIHAAANYFPKGFEHKGRFERGGQTARYWHPCVLRNGKYIPTEPTDYGPDLYADFLIDFMKRHKDGPFLAYFPMCLIHDPVEPVPDPNSPTGKTEGNLKSYVEYTDKLVGRIVKSLDDMGLRDNTIILFMGDNGTVRSGKGEVTELGARVPMIANGPGIPKRSEPSDELIDFSDFLPTLMEFAGADLPRDRTIDGRSFAPLLRGEKGKPREWIFSCLRNDRILRDKRWLLEGDGRFFDCGNSRDGSGYKDVTESKDPEVLAARKRFEAILKDLPAPESDFSNWRERRQSNSASSRF